MGTMHLEKGAHVVYGGYGVCLVEDIRPMDLCHSGQLAPSFVLRQEDAFNSTLYVPVENSQLCQRLRRVLTKGEIHELLLESKGHQLAWPPDRQTRAERFQGILQRGVQEELILMIRCIYLKKGELQARGKKLPDARAAFRPCFYAKADKNRRERGGKFSSPPPFFFCNARCIMGLYSVSVPRDAGLSFPKGRFSVLFSEFERKDGVRGCLRASRPKTGSPRA